MQQLRGAYGKSFFIHELVGLQAWPVPHAVAHTDIDALGCEVYRFVVGVQAYIDVRTSCLESIYRDEVQSPGLYARNRLAGLKAISKRVRSMLMGYGEAAPALRRAISMPFSTAWAASEPAGNCSSNCCQ